MEEADIQVELNIDVDSDEIERALLELTSPSELEAVVQRTLAITNILQPVTLNLLITDDEDIQALNKQYRKQDKPTDVLSFPLLDRPLVNAPTELLWLPNEEVEREYSGEAEKVPVFVTPAELQTQLGDIVISWPTIVRQAAEAGNSSAYELLYLLSHGVLHLIGYDDQTEAGYQTMVQIQQIVLEKVGRQKS